MIRIKSEDRKAISMLALDVGIHQPDMITLLIEFYQENRNRIEETKIEEN